MTTEIDKPIGFLKNNWRGRFVTVYPTSDPTKVRTIGAPFKGGEAIEVIEPRRDWERVIALYPEIAVYD